MTTKPYLFGFTSSIKGISFPGRPRIVTVEVVGQTTTAGNYTFNGETFTFAANRPVGPHNAVNAIALIPGTVGTLGLPTFKPPAAVPPVIINPFSQDMKNRLYAWQQPVPGYISADGTIGRAVLFLDMDNASPKIPYTFNIDTNAHGSSVPPGPPELNWYIYFDPLNLSYTNAAFVNATQDINTQTFRDITGTLPPGVDPTKPDQVATAGADFAGGGSMQTWQFNLPPPGSYFNKFGVQLSPSYSTEGAALIAIGNLTGSFGINSSAINFFPWATAVTPAGTAFCTWTITVKTWRRANYFTINPNGTLGNVFIVYTRGEPAAAVPVFKKTVTSSGGNPKACVNSISVVPGSMAFTVRQKFS